MNIQPNLLSAAPTHPEDGGQREGQRAEDEGGPEHEEDVRGGDQRGEEAEQRRRGEVEQPGQGLGQGVGGGEVLGAQLVSQERGVHSNLITHVSCLLG